MTTPLAKEKERLIVSLKKKRMFQENSDSISNIHECIAMNEIIHNVTQENRKDMPVEHKAVMDVIHEVEGAESEMREALNKLGVPKEEQPPESRALQRLNVEEKLRNGDNATHWKTTSYDVKTDTPTPPKSKLH